MYIRTRSLRFAGARCQHLVERRMGLVVFAFLHQSQCGLVLGNDLCACTICLQGVVPANVRGARFVAGAVSVFVCAMVIPVA